MLTNHDVRRSLT